MKKEILRMQEVCVGRYELGGLDHFRFRMKEGELVGLYGYSGAGKTVLYDYFVGDIPLKSGKVVFDGKICPVGMRFPYVQQVLCLGRSSTLIPGLSVAENIFVINGKRKGWNLVWKPNIYYRARILLSQYAPQLSPHTLARELTMGQMRLVELLRAIENEVKLVVIDDSFQGLGQSDMQVLVDILQVLKKRKVAILYETLEIKLNNGIMDKIVLLRKGKHIRTFYEEDFDETFCRKLLLGNETLPVFKKKPVYTTKERFRMDVTRIGKRWERTTLTVREGEIVGLYDMDNRNNIELLQMVLGEKHLPEVELFLEGKRYIPENTQQALDHRIGFLPRNMHEAPLVDTMDFRDNLSLPVLSRQSWRIMQNRKISRLMGSEYGQLLGISPEHMQEPVKNFDFYIRSNIYLARWVLFRPKLLVCMEPWADTDLILKDIMFRAFSEMTKRGTAILIASRNMNELRSICDSIYILNEEEEAIRKYSV